MTTAPFGGLAVAVNPVFAVIGAKGSMLIGVNSEHLGNLHSGLALLEVKEVRGKCHQVTASFAGGKVGPPPGGEVHLERTFGAIGPCRIDRDPFTAFAPAVGQPSMHERVGVKQRRFGDAPECDFAWSGGHGADSDDGRSISSSASSRRAISWTSAILMPNNLASLCIVATSRERMMTRFAGS
jgi:hypothetical protein